MRLPKQELRELTLFSDTRRSELARVARLLTRVDLPAGKVLVREGARGKEFMIIIEGEAAVTKGGETIATLGRGDLVGEMALLDENGSGIRNATVTALTDIAIYVGTPAEFREMISVAPSVAEKVQQTAASRVPDQARELAAA
jgi:CRP/FNR family cyclic AMP-dependent transcriptional regulator